MGGVQVKHVLPVMLSASIGVCLARVLSADDIGLRLLWAGLGIQFALHLVGIARAVRALESR